MTGLQGARTRLSAACPARDDRTTRGRHSPGRRVRQGMTGLQGAATLILPSADDRSGWASRFPRGCTPGWYVLPCQGKYKVTLQWARSADCVLASYAGERRGYPHARAQRTRVGYSNPLAKLFSCFRELRAASESICIQPELNASQAYLLRYRIRCRSAARGMSRNPRWGWRAGCVCSRGSHFVPTPGSVP
jgi:hypothetical protein